MPPRVAPSWIVALPKAEVHLHLEGCLDPHLVTAAARRQGVPAPEGPAPAGRISSLPELLDHLDWSCGLIDRAEDLAATACATARRASASGVRHIDVIVNPTHWPHWRGRLDAMVDALDEGFRAAEAQGFATAAVCVSLSRTQTEAEALSLVDALLTGGHPRVAALSIDGNESSGSHNERFTEAFARARRGGLRRCAHAGESSGPEGVRQAINLLGAERIDHGIRAVEDPGLVADLARGGIPLDICPTSNVVLGIVTDLAHHPMEALRGHGVPFSINTDDPLLYDIDVAGEYTRCAHVFGWGRAELAAVARTSIESCFAPTDRRHQLLHDLDAFLDR